jgi:plastocyanin
VGEKEIEMSPERVSQLPRGPAGAAVLVLIVAVVITALVLVAGCGGGGTTSTSGRTAPSGAAQITMKNIAFTPADVTVKVGQTVTWTNEDSAQHDVVANDGTFKSDLLSKGQSFSFTFTKAGSFAFYCSIHPQMKGTITVQP